MKIKIFIMSAVLLGGLVAVGSFYLKDSSMKPINNLKVRIYNGKTLPDPTDVTATPAWYMLNHISSALIGYDYKTGQFEPYLSKPWKIKGQGIYTFEISDDAKFHDGTPIKAADVEASIKRILIKRTSTHFHLWEYLVGCKHLEKMSDPCDGMKVLSDKAIEFHLDFRISSFLLQLATPETGIWYKGDIDPVTLEIKPTKFSGPYFVEKIDPDAFHLRINPYSPAHKQYPMAPTTIDVERISISKGEEEIAAGRIDVLIRGQKPMGERDWERLGLNVTKSAPSSLLYFQSTDPKGKKRLAGQILTKALWAAASDAGLTAASTFMPFKQSFTLDEATILKNLPEKSAIHFRVAIPDNKFFPEPFLDLIRKNGAAVGTTIDFVPVSTEEYMNYFNKVSNSDKADFVLGYYDITERFPAVQLRFITGVREIEAPVDLKLADVPDMETAQIDILKKYQEWLVAKGFVVPLFFARSMIIHKKGITMGTQSLPIGDVDLWRFSRAEVN